MKDFRKYLNPKYISPIIIVIFLIIFFIYQAGYSGKSAADMTYILQDPVQRSLESRIREFSQDKGSELNNIAHVIEAMRIYSLFLDLKENNIKTSIVATQFWRGTLKSYNIVIRKIKEKSPLKLTMEFMWKTENWQSNQGFQGIAAHFSSKTKKKLRHSITTFKINDFISTSMGALRASYIASASGWYWNDPLRIGYKISELKDMSSYEFVREMDMKNDWLGARMIDILENGDEEQSGIEAAYKIALYEWKKNKDTIIMGNIPGDLKYE